MITKKVRSTIASHLMLKKGEKVLVAVSGGVDSVVLLDILGRLSTEYSLSLIIAHLDHRLRGEESSEDARFVAKLAEQYGLPLIGESIDVRSIAEERKVGIEEAARFVRLRFLREAADDAGATKIAIGHTANDLAETMLFNLIRGAGMTGLAGIKPVNAPFIRPLIEISRSEIVSYANEHGLSWREDRSNADMAFTRNRIRHQIVPALSELNPDVIGALLRTAEIVREEQDAFFELLEQPWQEALKIEAEEGKICLNRAYVAHVSIGIRRALLRRALERVRGDLRGIGKVHIDSLCQLITSARAHGEIHLPGLLARVQGGELILISRYSRPETVAPQEVPLGRTEYPLFGIALNLEIVPWERDLISLKEAGQNVEIADADKIAFPLRLRTRRAGDRFSPLGLSGTKKLKDFLIDSHVPFYKRNTTALLCDEKRIILVVGKRLSDAVRVDAGTRRVLLIRWKEIT
ncbi:tRNA lysidine(34) synthetase TilS [Candidatus Bipolaricaulota bacterium]|nr:tRNA lysidine(34) synthetase TilS [Candidatus Bipolaricaulota bacterium]